MVGVLDCTLRDGGYYTDWDFDPDLVNNYVDSVARLPIEYIELGYVNDDTDGYYGEYYFLRREKLQAIKNRLRPDQKLMVMLDGKSASPDRVAPLFAHLVGVVDGVRITANPAKLGDALALAREFKKFGFIVGFNIMYLSSYQDDLSKLEAVIAAPECYDSLALVDSYGGCAPAKVKYAVEQMCKLVPNRAIGFHGHDNMCLAFANTLAAIEGGAEIVDGTFTGMGRGAGNARTETILIHLDRAGGNDPLDYQALANIVPSFETMRKKYEWGTNLAYMISGANGLPQKDVMDWLAKNRYSVVSIIRALQQQSGQEVDRTDYPDISELGLSTRNMLLIGGGRSVIRHVEAIRDLVARHDPIVVFSSSRYLHLADRIRGRQLVCLPGHDAVRAHAEEMTHVTAAIITPPPRVPESVPAWLPIPVYQAAPAPSAYEGPEKGPMSDAGPMALGLGVAEALGVEQCWLVGFDGYETATLAEQELSREVQASLDAFSASHGAQAIASLTPTRYGVARRSLHGLVAAV